jgi:internalin A
LLFQLPFPTLATGPIAHNKPCTTMPTPARALELIRECGETKSDFLDLGYLGLTEVPEEVFELTHLKGLNLGGYYYKDGEWHRTSNKDQGDYSSTNLNQILEVPLKIDRLQNLESLFLRENPITKLPIEKLNSNINMLDLSVTKLIDYNYIFQLPHLKILWLGGNLLIENITFPITEYPSLKQLYLSGSAQKRIPSFVGFTNLQYLDLSHNQISEINGLNELTQLQYLDLSHNQISEINGLSKLTQLLHLDLTNNRLSEIQSLNALMKIQYLDLSHNQISEIKNLNELTQLRSLNLSSNRINVVEGLNELIRLENLDVFDNQIREIKNLDGLTQLVSLSLSDNQITNIEALSKLYQLEFLNLWGNQITDIKPLAELTNLNSLELSRNQIREINNLSSLTQLKELDLSQNQIIEIKGLSQLTQLLSLELNSNNIIEIKDLHQLTELKILELSYNQITEIENLNELSQLRSLLLSHNQISEIKNLINLTQLETLDLSRNKISNIKNLDNLTQLKTLSLDCNLIIEIENLNYLSRLHNLNLSFNQISEIKNLNGLEYLKELDISNNKIDHLKEGDLEGQFIKKLSLSNNPLINLPPEIFNQENCLTDARNWFRDLNQESEISHEAKLILIGNGRVGKTCILKRLFYNTYQAGEPSTHAIALHSQAFDWVEAPYQVQLNSWDFGGQELYHATHRLFMQSRALYLAVWDYKTEYGDEKSVDEVSGFTFRNHPMDYWLENARSLSKHAPILLVQNKADRDGEQVLKNYQALQQRFKTIDSFHVSAESGSCFGVLKEAIKEEILKMPEIGMKVPAQWMRVKRKLQERKTEKTISQATYNALSSEEGLSQSSAETLLRFLHNTGNLFYHPDLHDDLIILDQEWVLEGIYAIFNRKHPFLEQLYFSRGFTSFRALSIPWGNFDGLTQKLFLSMMESCEICLQLSEDKENPKYLIPECLPNEEPEFVEYVWKMHEEQEHRLVYQHDFFHPAFMVRFICRAGRMSKSVDRIWRNGIWITYQKNTQALIQAFPQAHRIVLRVRGQYAAELLYLIHKEFREIFYNPEAVGIEVTVGAEAFETYYHPQNEQAKSERSRLQGYFKDILNPESEELAQKTLKDVVPPPIKTQETKVKESPEEVLERMRKRMREMVTEDLNNSFDVLVEFIAKPSISQDLNLVKAKYKEQERQYHLDLVEKDKFSVQEQQTRKSLLYLINELEASDLDMEKVLGWLT